MNNIQITIDDTTFDAVVQIDPTDRASALVTVDGKTVRITLPHDNANDAVTWALADGASYEVVLDPQLRWIRSSRGLHRLNVRDLETPAVRPASGDGRVKAPIPGTVTRILVEPSQHVETGQLLLVLEAMKMENRINAPRAGTVTQINVVEGQGVALNTVLVEIS